MISQTIKEIEAALGVDRLVEQIATLPSWIEQAQIEAQQLRQIVEERKNALALEESLLVAAINEEIIPSTGKAVYSNAEARKAELERRKSRSEEYLKAQDDLAQAESALAAKQFELDRLIREHASIKAIIELTAARLRLLA